MPPGMQRLLHAATEVATIGRGWLTARPAVTRRWALLSTERVGAVSAVVSSIEYLRGASQLGRFQLNDRDVVAGRRPRTWQSRLIDVVSAPGSYRMLHVSRLGSGVLLLVPAGGRLRALASGHLALTSYAIYRAEPRGLDGADEVALMVQSASCLGRARGSRSDADAALWFLAGQSALSYFSSGVAKLVGPTWTRGEALAGVLRTHAHGHEVGWRFLRDRPWLNRLATRAVVAGELLVPLLLVRGRFARIYVLVANLFHTVNGFLMGLGRFTIAFGGLYPAILYVSSPNDGTRSRDLPGTAAAIASLAVAGSVAGAVVRDRWLRTGIVPAARFTAPSGDELAYHVFSPTDGASDRPVVVIEAGLAATAAHVRPLGRALASRGLTAVAHHRAGYPPVRAGAAAADFGMMHRNLADLANHAAAGRPVVLVGHSLGGPLALMAAPRVDGLLGVVVLDPSHLEHRHRLVTETQLSSRALGLTEVTLRCGLGSALQAPWEFSLADTATRREMLAAYRHPATWQTLRAELAAYLDARDPGGSRAEPMLVVTSGGTAAVDPPQLEADARLAGTARHLVVDGCSHLSMLWAESAVTRIADAIVAAIEQRSATSTDESRAQMAAAP